MAWSNVTGDSASFADIRTDPYVRDQNEDILQDQNDNYVEKADSDLTDWTTI